jgi:POT family proton-dependent oligopeptide transporter
MSPSGDEGTAESALPLTPTPQNAAASVGAPTSHPIGFWFFFWGELAERSSYYGMRAILALYMVEQLNFSKANASTAMHAFIASCYLLPLVGGWVADNFFGKYWTIVGFSIPYILGHVILGVESVPFLIVALCLLAMGSGVIKPNISTLMGMTYDQQRPGQEKLRSDAFAMFYGAINVGAFLSSVAMPLLRKYYGYQIAFLFPAALMVGAFFIFAIGKRYYAVETISRHVKTPEERATQWLVLAKISGVFAVVTFFWSVFDQSASTWTFFAKDYLDLELFGVTFEPDMIQAANPLLIVIMLPLVTAVWHLLDGAGIKLRPTDKMLIGFVLTTITMGMMAAAGFLTSPEHKATVLWEVAAYVVITLAEICISVVGLELAFTAAPANMKSFITACWLFTVFVADSLAIPVTSLYEKMSPGPYFSLLTGMMLVVTVVFVFVAGKFNRQIPVS